MLQQAVHIIGHVFSVLTKYENKTKDRFVRQPALRLFASELTGSKETISERIEGRDFKSRYQLTPTGVKAKRVLMMGALVEVDNVSTSGDYLRGRIIDPTGAFIVYAGQYQPEALLALSRLTIPCFVAVVGKINAYRPDEKTTIVSIRPETIVEIDAKTRDYWVKETVARTLERVKKSQLLEIEKEKFRQMCKDALTKLIYAPQPQEAEIEDETLITQHISCPEEQLKPENGFSKISGQGRKSRTKRNNPVKRPAKKKIIEQRFANDNQKTLFTETQDQE